MSSKTYESDAIVHRVSDIDGVYVEFPCNVETEFGKGRAKVHATFDGIPYGGSVVSMGIENADGSAYYITDLHEDIRTKIGKQSGDSVYVTIQERD